MGYIKKILKGKDYYFNCTWNSKQHKRINTKEIKIKGLHNYENIMAAIAAVKVYNITNENIIKVLTSFKGVEHRIEYVDNINDVSYYNDAKSTNCESTKTALNSFTEPTLLILGGLDRHHSFEELTPCMQNVKYVACYGETKNRIKEYCQSINIDCKIYNNLKEATLSCYEKATNGDIVLLSPACASWDQYEKFEDRGDEFKAIIKELKEK